MKILRHEPYTLPAMLDGTLRPMGTDRVGGLHLSTVIKRMRAEIDGKVPSDIAGEQEGLRAQCGFLWERAIEHAWKEYQGVTRTWVEHGKAIEAVADGIAMSPDGVDRREPLLEEYKATWRSRRKADEAFESEFWPWHVQTMAYARALGLPLRCRYIVMWFGGAYYKGPNPHIGPWETVVEWTQAEVDESWDTVLRYRDVVLREQETGR